MEDFRIDVMTGEGAFASAIQIGIQPFTLVGATTRTGLLTAPLFSRFGHVVRLDFYPPRSSRRSSCGARGCSGDRSTPDAAHEIARRARGTPRVANRLLRRVRDFAEVLGRASIAARRSSRRASGSRSTRPASTRWTGAYLRIIIDDYDGGPVGVETLAAALGRAARHDRGRVRAFLMQQGYLGGRRGAASRPEGLRAPGASKAPASGMPRPRAKDLF
jgi:Holliday junction DNA helicase RuvB